MYLADFDLVMLTVIHSMYQNMTSKVQWRGNTSEEFCILQGTRQGGVLSADLYELYINNLLIQLENSGCGLSIGNIYLGSPTVADDMTLLTNITQELQTMLDIANNYAVDEKYRFNPSKTDIVNLGGKMEDDEVHRWVLDLSPSASYAIYRCYVLPRFLYGLGSMVFTSKQISTMEASHRKILREIQSLPVRTSTAAIINLLEAFL